MPFACVICSLETTDSCGHSDSLSRHSLSEATHTGKRNTPMEKNQGNTYKYASLLELKWLHNHSKSI